MHVSGWTPANCIQLPTLQRQGIEMTSFIITTGRMGVVHSAHWYCESVSIVRKAVCSLVFSDIKLNQRRNKSHLDLLKGYNQIPMEDD